MMVATSVEDSETLPPSPQRMVLTEMLAPDSIMERTWEIAAEFTSLW